MAGFGRKGVDGMSAGGFAPARGFGAATVPAASADDGLSPQARAFIAAERARRAEEAPVDPVATAQSAAKFAPSTSKAERSLVLAYVLWWFGGPLGAHRFYLGATASGIAMLGLLFGGFIVMFLVPLVGMTMVGGCLLWTLVDAFLIPGLRKRHAELNFKSDLALVFS